MMEYQKPLELFAEKSLVRMCAPMVRYSRLAFRNLVRNHGTDLAFTPMFVSDSFLRSQKARDADFRTNEQDRPLVAQFAASNARDFSDVAVLISPHVDGIDLNCGCPQKWAMAEGYGATLVKSPELIKDMVLQARRRTELPVSIKIRLCDDTKRTVELVRRAEHAGAAWVTVHGRTAAQRTQSVVDYDMIRTLKDSVKVPVVANGDIMSDKDAIDVQERTGVDGVMSARGMLANPAMYEGYEVTPWHVVQEWIDTSLELGTPFPCFHHHLIQMLDAQMSKAGKP